MIKIFNKTQNEVVSETFWSFPEVRDFLSSNEYGKAREDYLEECRNANWDALND